MSEMQQNNFNKTFIASIISDVGKCRKNNEDNFLLNNYYNSTYEHHIERLLECKKLENWFSMAVFDGMGGVANGEVASLFAAQEVESAVKQLKLSNNCKIVDACIRTAFLNANNRIVNEREKRAVCGTTGTVIITDGILFKVYHIGDSRAYLYRNGSLFQLTKDQTVAEMKKCAGFLDDEIKEIEKHQLTEYIGADKSMVGLCPQESEWLQLQKGDKIMLCTDGLYDMCPNIQLHFKMHNVENIVVNLVKEALDNGGVDNITCALLSVL